MLQVKYDMVASCFNPRFAAECSPGRQNLHQEARSTLWLLTEDFAMQYFVSALACRAGVNGVSFNRPVAG